MGRGPAMSMPVEKAKDFKGTMKRLFGYLKPFKLQLGLVFLAAALSTLFNIASPKILGLAITKLYEVIQMKLQGIPGASIDFVYTRNILFVLIGLYITGALFTYYQNILMADITQKTVYELRKEVNRKLSHVPLKYFDQRTHGEILSRVTGDMDNISSTLQQSVTQFITSIVTLLGVLIMMLSISPLMTLLIIATLPFYGIVTKFIVKRSQKYFVAQQKTLGDLNGHIEEMYTGHEIIKGYGREKYSLETFKKINEQLYDSSFKSQFMSGTIMPLMMFIGNIGFVVISVMGGLFVTKGTLTIGDVQAFIQY